MALLLSHSVPVQFSGWQIKFKWLGFFRFLAFISTLIKWQIQMKFPTESWGRKQVRTQRRNWIHFVPVFTSSKQHRVRTGFKEKARCTCKICCFSFTHWARFDWRSHCCRHHRRPASSLLPGFIDVRKRLGIRTRFWQKRLPSFH